MGASTTFTVKTTNGTEIFAQYWAPSQARAVVIVCHGLGEHSGRYAHVGANFNEIDIALLGYDHTGHGKSAGGRGHVPAFAQLMEELDLMMSKAAELFPGLPVFLYGHSWGGNIALNYLLRKKPAIKAAIITGPWLLLPEAPPALKVMLAKLVRNILPSLAQPTGLNPKLISRDPAEVDAYIKDPLVHSKLSAANFLDSNEAAAYALDHAAELKVPTLLMHGSKDGITAPEGSKQFAAKSPQFTTLKLWEGYFHEIHNDLGKADALLAMNDFLKQQLG
jgi:alpha-beta hydrolase superfamily lysophospholipase